MSLGNTWDIYPHGQNKTMAVKMQDNISPTRGACFVCKESL